MRKKKEISSKSVITPSTITVVNLNDPITTSSCSDSQSLLSRFFKRLGPSALSIPNQLQPKELTTCWRIIFAKVSETEKNCRLQEWKITMPLSPTTLVNRWLLVDGVPLYVADKSRALVFLTDEEVSPTASLVTSLIKDLLEKNLIKLKKRN